MSPNSLTHLAASLSSSNAYSADLDRMEEAFSMLSEMSSIIEATEALEATMNFPSEVIMLGEALIHPTMFQVFKGGQWKIQLKCNTT